MFRFKLRTLLIATALVAVFLGMQVCVHNKTKKFIEEATVPTDDKRFILGRYPSFKAVPSTISPISFGDIVFVKRRCEIRYEEKEVPQGVFVKSRQPKRARYGVFLFCETKGLPLKLSAKHKAILKQFRRRNGNQ